MAIFCSIEVKFIENKFSPDLLLFNELLSNFNFNSLISFVCILINFFNSDDSLILSIKFFISSFFISNSFSKYLILSFNSLFLFFSSFN